MTFEFSLEKRQSPFIVGVGIYAGTGFVGFAIDTDRMRALEAAVEFGVYKSLDFGVAAGRAQVFGGLYYGAVAGGAGEGSDPIRTTVTFVAFVRAGGSLTAWGFITVSADLYLGLTARQTGAGDSAVDGTARYSFSVKIGFVRKSFAISYTQRFSGSKASDGPAENRSAALILSSPTETLRRRHTRGDQFSYEEWLEYVTAFPGS